MDPKHQEWSKLATKWLAGTATESEKLEIDTWYNSFNDDDYETVSNRTIEQTEDILLKRIFISAQLPIQTKRKKLWKTIAAVAAVLFGAVVFFYTRHLPDKHIESQVVINDLKPGSDQAVLTLSDGSKIELNELGLKNVFKNKDLNFIKNKPGQITFRSKIGKVSAKGTNLVSTPRAGQWHVILSDGTNVWLNASSSLSFSHDYNIKKRSVVLTGEAYFEVVKDQKHPFSVITGGQEVVVTGTHFNISNYQEDEAIQTTLLEGSVNVLSPAGSKKLLPGQQSLLISGRLTIKEIDAEEVIAWKNGDFLFNDERLEMIMKKLSRWYDFTVTYTDDDIKDKKFSGTITRFTNVSKVLKMLELTGHVDFKVEGQKITASDPKR